jgi:hypothetical protein
MKNLIAFITTLTIVNSLLANAGQVFRVGYADSLTKVRLEKEYAAILPDTNLVNISCARQESEAFQLVVIPNGATLDEVNVRIAEPFDNSDLAVRAYLVDYVETSEPCYKTDYVGYWPDPLVKLKPFTVPADRVAPVWFTVDVGPDASAGKHTAEIEIKSGESIETVELAVNVRNFTLPKPGTIAMPFGLYAPILSRWQYGEQPYEDNMTIEKFAQWCEFMGQYRLTPKNIGYEYVNRKLDGKELPQLGADAAKYISGEPEEQAAGNDSPHYHQAAGGKTLKPVTITDNLEVDMTLLQTTVGELSSKYYPPYSFGLYRLPTAPFFREGLIKKDPEAVAKPFRLHAEEWKRQGLPMDVFVYGVDEPKDPLLDFLRQTYLEIKKDYPSAKIMQTISHKNPEKLIGAADIWCPLTPSLESEFYKKRQEAGDMLWTYVCVSPRDGRHANFFIDEPAINHRILLWQAKKHKVTGFLYWAVCWWEGFPSPADSDFCFPSARLRMKDHIMYTRNQVNGDGVLMYPDEEFNPLPSIRLECIRDGIEDYEYISLLEKLVQEHKNSSELTPRKRQILNDAQDLCNVPENISKSMTAFTRDTKVLLERREKVADAIEEILKFGGVK